MCHAIEGAEQLNAKRIAPRQLNIGVAITVALFSAAIIGMSLSSWVQKSDFAVPYTGGLILRQGHAPRMYDLAEQERVQEALLMRRGLLLDMYPPYHALLFAPLTLLGYRAAYLVWGAVNILLWLLFRYLVREERSKIQPFQFLILSALFAPLWVALIQGQFSILLLVSMGLAFVYLKCGKDWSAGLALSLGLLKFQILVPFAVIFLLRRKWRFLGGLAAGAGVLTAVSLIAVGPLAAESYGHLLLDTFRHPHTWAYLTIKPSNMPTIRGLVNGLFAGVLPGIWLTVMSGALSGCVILATALLWERRSNSANFDLMFAAAVVVSLLTAPYLYPHDLTPLILAMTLVVASPGWKAKSSIRSLLLFVISVLYASPFYLATLLGREELYLLAPLIAVFAFVVLFLAGGPQESVSLHEPDLSLDLSTKGNTPGAAEGQQGHTAFEDSLSTRKYSVYLRRRWSLEWLPECTEKGAVRGLYDTQHTIL